MKILEVRKELVIAEVGGNLSTRPNSPYYTLKYTTYENARIAYTFGAGQYIRETYDDRIFNCWCNGKRLQLRQDLSNRLALCIQDHELTGTSDYEKLFIEAYNEIPDMEILHTYLRNYKSVEFIEHDGFVVHEIFKIDLKGNAHQMRLEDNKWRSMCIVMQETGASTSKSGCIVPDENGDMREINGLTMTIMSKVLFMREPELQEKQFIGYLPEELQIRLNKVRGGDSIGK